MCDVVIFEKGPDDIMSLYSPEEVLPQDTYEYSKILGKLSATLKNGRTKERRSNGSAC